MWERVKCMCVRFCSRAETGAVEEEEEGALAGGGGVAETCENAANRCGAGDGGDSANVLSYAIRRTVKHALSKNTANPPPPHSHQHAQKTLAHNTSACVCVLACMDLPQKNTHTHT